MKRVALLAAVGFAGLSAVARAQLVPLTRCQAAFPCSMPYGLRPADAVMNLPDARLGNTLVSAAVDGALKPRLVAPPHDSSDFAEDAARLFVRKNPLAPTSTPTPAPTATPTAKPASGPKDLELP
ncbi:MAG TPA: hypothetical protein VKG23_21040 [Thermoanaerobaculia bacterium]|nr:hypothetical protein [Thermoanaerobaculia bacterium]